MAIDLNGSTGISLDDNEKINIGNDSDLQIYHDGSHSYIVDAGTGNMYISTDGNGIVMQASLSETMFAALPNGAVTLYHDNAAKLVTTATGIDVTGTAVMDGLTLGANNANSPQILFENSDGVTGDAALSTYDDSSGTMLVMGSNFYINSSGSETRFNTSEESSAVMLNRNGDLNLMTGGTGATATTRLKIDSSGKLLIGDSSSHTSDLLQIETPASGGGHGIQIRRNDSNADQGVGSITFGNNTATDLASISAKTDGATDNGALLFNTSVTGGANTERMRVDASGRLMLGTAAPFSGSNGSLYIETDAVVSRNLIAMNNTGSGTNAAGVVAIYRRQNYTGGITNTYTSTQYITSSDYRLKENVVDLTGASARVNQLNVKRFNFIADTDTTVDGFLAHEVATVVPEAINGTKDAMRDEEYEVTPAVLDDDGNVTTEAVMGTRSVPDYQGIDQSKLVPLLTAALQEALTEIASLKTRVEALEA